MFALQRVHGSFCATIAHSTRLQRYMYLEQESLAAQFDRAGSPSDEMEPMLWLGHLRLLPELTEVYSGGFDIEFKVFHRPDEDEEDNTEPWTCELNADKTVFTSSIDSWRKVKLCRLHHQEPMLCHVTVYLYLSRKGCTLEWYEFDWLLPADATAGELAHRITVLARRTWDEHLELTSVECQSRIKGLLEKASVEREMQKTCVTT